MQLDPLMSLYYESMKIYESFRSLDNKKSKGRLQIIVYNPPRDHHSPWFASNTLKVEFHRRPIHMPRFTYYFLMCF